MAGGAARVALSAVVFVVSGLAQTVCVQALLYSGGGDRSTFLVALPNYAGILLVYVVGARAFRALDRLGVWEARRRAAADPAVNRVHVALYLQEPEDAKRAHSFRLRPITFLTRLVHPERRKLFVLAFNELGGFLTGLMGLSIAGSGLYQVVFSGGTVFTALLSVFFLRKRLSCAQWLFVGVITLGLMITAEQVAHAPTGDGAHAANMISGVAFVLVSCLFYSTNYVIAEHFLDGEDAAPQGLTANEGPGLGRSSGDHPRGPILAGDDSDLEASVLLHKSHSSSSLPPLELPPPSGLDLSLYTGGSCLLVFGLYVLVHTVPRWNELVTLSIERHRGNGVLIAEEYFYLGLGAFLHALSHYDIVATVGAIPVGVLNALRAVSVFGVSSLLFCEHQASQCYNARKGASTAIVILGAIGYSVASAKRPPVRAAPFAHPGDRRGMHRRNVSVGLQRSLSAPFLNDPALATGSTMLNWFRFGKRRKDADT